MKNRYNYFYKITNNINGKYYYGVHSTTDLNDGYMGSGKVLRRAQKRYGIEHFTKEILRYFDTEEEMYAYEREMVDMERVRDINCYNVAKGGFGGDTLAGMSEEERDARNIKLSASLTGRKLTEEHRKHLSEGSVGKNKGKTPWNKGKPRSEETKRKISEKNKGHLAWNKGKPGTTKGKHWRLDPETNKRIYY